MKKFIAKKAVQIMFAVMMTAGFSVCAVAAPQEAAGSADVSGMSAGKVLAPFAAEPAGTGSFLPSQNFVIGADAPFGSGAAVNPWAAFESSSFSMNPESIFKLFSLEPIEVQKAAVQKDVVIGAGKAAGNIAASVLSLRGIFGSSLSKPDGDLREAKAVPAGAGEGFVSKEAVSVNPAAAVQEIAENDSVSAVSLKSAFMPSALETVEAGALLPNKDVVIGGAKEAVKDTAEELDVLKKMLEFIVHDDKPVTGIIVDARGYSLESTFSPLIYDEEGNIIYGRDNVDKDKALSQGLVEYAVELEGGFKSSRVGDSPMVINALSARSGCNSANRVNVVISMADAEKIRKAEADGGVLTKMAVVFVR